MFDAKLNNLYGLSEALVFTSDTECLESDDSFVGMPLPEVELAIVRDGETLLDGVEDVVLCQNSYDPNTPRSQLVPLCQQGRSAPKRAGFRHATMPTMSAQPVVCQKSDDPNAL